MTDVMDEVDTAADRNPAARTHLSELVHSALWDRISGGQYPRRTRLPSERELAIEFHVSRPVVRAALARLRTAGLVESIKGSGTVIVRQPDVRAGAANGGATLRDLQRCFEFRMLVEGEAAYFAARRAAPALLDEIEAGLDARAEAIARGDADRGDTFRFHWSVVSASDNPYYQRALDLMSNEPAFKIYLARSVGNPAAVAHVTRAEGEHRQILEFIRRREADEARNAMQMHIDGARENFMACVPLG